jgi:hypothetical protein
MKPAKKYIPVAGALLIVSVLLAPSAYASPGRAPTATSPTAASASAASKNRHMPLAATSPAQTAPLAEPYEPGSSTVVNDWQFTPDEKTTIAR